MSDCREHKCLIIACGALAKEILAVRDQLGISADNLTLQCLPAKYHNTPQKIVPGIEAILTRRIAEFDTILVGYGDCGTGGALDALLEKYNVSRIPGAHCYEFFSGSRCFHDLIEEELGSFFLTDFLVRHFDRIIMQGLGIEQRPRLRDLYFGNYKRVVYLVQEHDPVLIEKAEIAAGKIGLELVTKEVGYGALKPEMAAAMERASANV